MDVIAFLGRIAIIALIFLLLNVDYIGVVHVLYQKYFSNQTTDLYDKSKNLHQKKQINKKEFPVKKGLVEPRVPGLHGGTVALNLDEQIEKDTIEKLGLFKSKYEVLEVLKEHCLPKLICEMSATPRKNTLSSNERELLNLIKQSNILIYGTMSSKYHYAAHMGQLISGLEGQGCHNFYPSCPFQSVQVLQMIRRARPNSIVKRL
ncbi:uncharacterized protein LOC123303071 [Chrysoperla carnea]|uniref:uncharacterized protein LOC123303071 n=1 Tax=Chrysoperla carnea TaxID=189513 RepID=UPI001D090FAD|nr:uncharacterized protein LOC123303071 [Chrysoperla carnea]